jgi:hypothetical protein
VVADSPRGRLIKIGAKAVSHGNGPASSPTRCGAASSPKTQPSPPSCATWSGAITRPCATGRREVAASPFKPGQPLDRTHPGLPIKTGLLGSMTQDYIRHSTTTLFEPLNWDRWQHACRQRPLTCRAAAGSVASRSYYLTAMAGALDLRDRGITRAAHILGTFAQPRKIGQRAAYR